MTGEFQPQQTLRRVASLVAADVNDDLVILSITRGKYYGTQTVGKHIWSMLEQPVTVSAISDRLMQTFEVDRATCDREVASFLRQLLDEGLIELV